MNVFNKNLKIALALDDLPYDEMQKIIVSLKDYKDEIIFKINHFALYVSNNKIINFLKKYNFEIFLDFKLYDIPNTMATIITTYGNNVDYLTIHLQAGLKNIQVAQNVTLNKCQLIGVTVLTSEIRTSENIALIDDLTQLAIFSGLKYVVCSPSDLNFLNKYKSKISFVTPSIRWHNGTKIQYDDQNNFLTPWDAIEQGSKILIIGRPIIKSLDPIKSFLDLKKILNEKLSRN